MFTAAEARDSSPVAIINQTMAKRLWPGADPLGAASGTAHDSPALVHRRRPRADIANEDLTKEPQLAAYLPLRFGVVAWPGPRRADDRRAVGDHVPRCAVPSAIRPDDRAL
jgi:hypothetical protein